MRKEFLGRGWRFPIGFDPAKGGTATSEFEENIRQCITIILSTKIGERQMMPDFGCRMHDFMFSPNTPAVSAVIAHHVEEALTRWEPRIVVKAVNAWPEPGGQIRVAVAYTIQSTMTEQELSLLLTSGG